MLVVATIVYAINPQVMNVEASPDYIELDDETRISAELRHNSSISEVNSEVLYSNSTINFFDMLLDPFFTNESGISLAPFNLTAPSFNISIDCHDFTDSSGCNVNFSTFFNSCGNVIFDDDEIIGGAGENNDIDVQLCVIEDDEYYNITFDRLGYNSSNEVAVKYCIDSGYGVDDCSDWVLNSTNPHYNESYVKTPIGGIYQSFFFESDYGGIYNVTIHANDTIGNMNDTEKTSFFVNDWYPPGVSLDSPNDGSTRSNGNITFNCSADDDYNLVNMTLYTNTSGAWQAEETKSLTGIDNSTGFLINEISLGTYNWNCLAYDNDSMSSWASHNYSLTIGNDSDLPVISLIGPANNTIDNDGSVLFTYNVTDATSSINNCSLLLNDEINNTDYSINEGTAQAFYLSGLNEDSYNWSINCYDNFDDGNLGVSDKMSVEIYDNTTPIVSLVNPENGYTDKTGDVLFEYVVKDSSNDIANCSLIFNGTINQTDSTVVELEDQNFTINNLTYGTYEWTVNCTDTSSNANEGTPAYTWEVIVNEKPSVTLNSPAFNSTDIDGDIVFNYTVQDDGLLNNCTLYHNISGIWQANQSNTFVQTNVSLFFYVYNIADGEYGWNVYCYDDARNPTEVKGRYTNMLLNVNKLPPEVSTMPNLSWSEDDTLELNLSNYFSDPKGDDLTYSVWHSNNVSITINNDTNMAVLESDKNWFGNISAVFTAFDEHDMNTSSNNITYTVFEEGDTKPRFISVTPINNSIDDDGYIFFEVNVTDDYALTNVSLYSNRTNENLTLEETKVLTGLTNSTIFNLTDLSDGLYEWAIVANDNASQQEWTEIYVVNVSVQAELSHGFPSWIVNNVNTTRYVTISYSSYLNNSLVLGNLTIHEADGELYFTKNMSEVSGFDANLLMYHPQKVNLTPDEVFDNNFTVGNTAGLNMSFEYYYKGKSYELKDNVTIEIFGEAQW